MDALTTLVQQIPALTTLHKDAVEAICIGMIHAETNRALFNTVQMVVTTIPVRIIIIIAHTTHTKDVLAITCIGMTHVEPSKI